MITAGEVLKNKRESLGKDLEEVSIDTKIQKRFLEYIEGDQYEKFDSDIFVTGFIKIYSKYLGLDVEKLLAIYRRSNPKNGKKQKKTTPFLTPKKKGTKIKITPQLIAILTLMTFLVSVVGYIGLQIYKFQTPPQLEILAPTDEYETTEEEILIKGTTDFFALVEINEKPVEVDTDGYFETELSLNSGINTISITARKESNTQLATTRTIKVIYKTDSIQEPEEVSDEQVFTLVLDIQQSSSWIKLDVDDENKLSQVLEPNTQHEYVFKKSFTLVTGRVQSTKLSINGEEIKISSSQNTGVGQITCGIVDNKPECN